MKIRHLVPLLLFLALAVLLAFGLSHERSALPSPLIDRPLPDFRLAGVEAGKDKGGGEFVPAQMRGEVWLLNVWASWCVSCRAEHSVLIGLGRQLPVVGLNYKEVRGDGNLDARGLTPEMELSLARQRASAWLAAHGGSPFRATALDLDGRVGIDLGVYGVPESFLIDRAGRVRYKHTGPLTAQAVQQELLPRIEALQHEQK
ncbi:thiol:disulfide interchange protein [Betaproteobacteria bacterium]|nr:thiol:disulfide interchange protein [Betaproteobacteria bacterium]GHU02363.1 thiol:disulfide interchange protein [Betaproteobacteria bacterium]GHU23495.1 thiol:disulfide interchange protein [Betaproteobacteria bacterium]GHU23523.1 thiol:disulfide interchange protein [Betaproteobacteria bacterium]GHU32259.1 thiol:disulfide interchange protein [Betaproteobacteria bacterium]